MAAWMLYLTVCAGALSLAGWLAERGLRHLGRPVRWVWVTVMVATVALPLAVALGGGKGAAGPAPESSAADVVLLAAWTALSLVLLANLRMSAWTLRRNEGAWRTAWIDGHRVHVSAGFGPGVIGALRPRMVLPGWALDADASLRRLILLHEEEHVRAGDTRLLLGGLILAMLVPWCLPLWWQLHRLCVAVETDCDARVLARNVSATQYANALVTIAGGPRRWFQPVPTLAPTRGELERRIRFITGHARGRSNRAGLTFLSAALIVMIGLTAVPAPQRPALDLQRNATAVEVPGEARVMISLTP